MKFFAVLCLAIQAIALVSAQAQGCDENTCKIESNCRCSNGASPLDGDLSEWPQLVSLTFDDAITERVYNDYLEPLLFSRTNPDNNPIGATFFVPHEYTDYQRVNDLYSIGFEIGVHSITKEPHQKYWREATEETLIKEFKGQKQIIKNFANIPEESIIGVRTPQLQMAGNFSIKAYLESGLTYDSSWPSLPSKRMFPYTLDYLSTQECLLGYECPNESFPGFWILPINELIGNKGIECNAVASCKVSGSAEFISNWLTDQVESVRNSTKVPMTLMFNSGWFNSTENSAEGFTKFLDNLLEKKDVFLVSQKQVVEWIKEPVKLAEFQTDSQNDEIYGCDKTKCLVKKGAEDRNFNICTACPKNYPWLDNPDGN
ncbi:unnamed protein product [Psylliodes chrysocephalus]|uniref:NodB homology domain-containing protein n=1 Tax=Psylliodes chrysocephalus TaxID=3402493 RepID=A0A9P0CCV0_9CUCU|nr:unnamed protein product [Psylliodes chrysocephala]